MQAQSNIFSLIKTKLFGDLLNEYPSIELNIFFDLLLKKIILSCPFDEDLFDVNAAISSFIKIPPKNISFSFTGVAVICIIFP